MARPKKQAKCHPNKQNVAKGLCRNCYNKKWYKKNPEALVKQQRQTKRAKNKNKELTRKKNILKRYNIDGELYDFLIKQSKGICGICKKATKDKRGLCVDHNHKTTKVRGLLCINCNTGLGMFKESIKIMREAIKYIKRHS